MIRWPLRRKARPIEPPSMVNHKHAELETAKEILAEIFCVRAVEVDEMIHSRMAERCWAGTRGILDQRQPGEGGYTFPGHPWRL
jgi:hypothetical protein